MKESLVNSVVGTVTGTVESTANALTGTTTSSSSGDSHSSRKTTAPATTTDAPTSTPSATTKAPSTGSRSTSTPSTSTKAPSTDSQSSASDTSSPATTSSPTQTTATPSTDASTSASDWTSSPTASASTQPSSPSVTAASPSASDSYSRSGASMPTISGSGSSSTQLRRNDASVSIDSGSSGGEAGITDVSDADLGTASVVGLVLGALGALLLLALLVSWCLRRKRKQLNSSIGHVRLGATGDIPVFNTKGTERFETSSSSVSFGPFRTAQVDSEHRPSEAGSGRPGLWEDEVITAMRIPLEKLTTTALLSSGGYGEVYRGVYRDEPVAVKVLLPEKQKDLAQINAFLAEIKMMATVEHHRVVRFIGASWDALSDLCAVMEFMDGGDLRSLLDRFQQEQRPRGFDPDKTRIALQTAQALTYLHSLNPKVLHRDLKSKNILLTSTMDAKLSDFGVARKYSFSSMTAAVGTSLWMAPEVMLGERYDASADIFSFGVVLSELDSHLCPYAEARMTDSGQRVPDAALLQLVAMGRVSVTFSPSAPDILVNLGRACVSLDPSARPSASEVHYQLQLLTQSFELYTL